MVNPMGCCFCAEVRRLASVGTLRDWLLSLDAMLWRLESRGALSDWLSAFDAFGQRFRRRLAAVCLLQLCGVRNHVVPPHNRRSVLVAFLWRLESRGALRPQ